jgi:hypothetical protein
MLHELAFSRMRSRDSCDAVLSIGKLRVGNEHYYLHTVAGGVEDYYVGRAGTGTLGGCRLPSWPRWASRRRATGRGAGGP